MSPELQIVEMLKEQAAEESRLVSEKERLLKRIDELDYVGDREPSRGR